MKKFLALVLALVMTMSLVTISAGAEFTDADSVTYEEAVDVMTALGVVSGDTTGAFNPTAGLTRGAAAKIICNMILGVDVASALNAAEAPFADVSADHVFAGYIAFCAQEGIVSGYADGSFKPAAPLSGYAFLKMLLGALGYDADVEGLVGTNWSINVAKLAKQRGLTTGNESYVGSKAITREEAMLYAFNTMKSETVTYTNAGSTSITIGDIVIKNEGVAQKDAGDYFYEDSFGKLGLTNANVAVNSTSKGMMDITATGTDDFGRPTYTWYLEETTSTPSYNDGVDTVIGDYGTAANLTLVLEKDYSNTGTYASEVAVINKIEDPATAYTLAGTAEVWLNGAELKDTAGSYTYSSALASSMKNGAVVEIWTNATTASQIDRVVVYDYTLVKVDKATAYNAADDMVKKYGASEFYTLKKDSNGDGTFEAFSSTYTYVDTLSKDKSNTIALGDLAKGDLYAAVLDANDEIIDLKAIETVEGKVDATGTGYVRVDGVKYFVSQNGTVALGNEGKFFLDPNGMVFGKDLTKSTTISDALYIVAQYVTEDTTYGSGDYTLYVQAVDMNGEVKELAIQTAADDTNLDLAHYTGKGGNAFDPATIGVKALVKATYNADTKVYDLVLWNAVDAGFNGIDTSIGNGVQFKKDSTKVNGIYVNDATKYIVVEKELSKIKVTNYEGGMAYTLVSGDSSAVVYTTVTGNKVADFVVIDLNNSNTFTSDATASDTMLYVKSDATYETKSMKIADVDTNVYTYEVYDMAGAAKEITSIDLPSAVAGFVTYTVKEEGAYDLSVYNSGNTSVSLAAKYDDEKGVIVDQIFASYYGSALTTTTQYFEDIDTAEAKIVDLRDTTASGAYTFAVDTLEAMKEAMDAGWIVTVSMYVDDGASVVFVTDVTKVTVTNPAYSSNYVKVQLAFEQAMNLVAGDIRIVLKNAAGNVVADSTLQTNQVLNIPGDYTISCGFRVANEASSNWSDCHNIAALGTTATADVYLFGTLIDTIPATMH